MTKSEPDKPSYRVPSMDEISAMPWNGLRVASTFSGCGGSCLGYRMAGFKVVWANEFVPIAQDTYRKNHPTSILDCRDIRTIQPDEILAAIGMKSGELDLFDGSPPCQAFSTAGKRAKGWGHEKTYEHGAKQCNEDLFFEYIRLLDGLKPRVFVAENVSGLVKGVAKGYFLEILAKLKACGYRVGCKVLDAQWLGVPQARQRTIFIGVREDLGREPVFPKPLPYRYSLREALPWIVRGKYGPAWKSADAPSPTVSAGRAYNPETSHQGLELVESKLLPPSRQNPQGYAVTHVDCDKPSPTVTIASPGNDIGLPIAGRSEKRKLTIAELKRICAFPDDFVLTGTYSQQWERLGNAVPPVMMQAIAKVIARDIFGKTVA